MPASDFCHINALVTNDRWFQNPLAQIEDERREHHTKLIKMEKEMEEVFERKVSPSLISE